MSRSSENHHLPTADTGRVFVGRKPELVALGSALERAISGKGGIVLVAGEPGIGKSELADRIAGEALGRGTGVLWGRSWEGEGAPPYWAWAQIIRDYVRERADSELEFVIGAAAPYLAQIAPEIRDRLPDLPAPAPLDSEQARFRLFDAVTTFLKAAAAKQPFVLILDDLHWADKPSLLLLRFLAHEIGDSRLLAIAIYRDVEVSHGHPLAEVLPSLRRERTVERILLRGLPEEDVGAMLTALRGEKLPEALARAISRETEGNPFFIQEIVRHLIEEGVLGAEAGWTSRSRLEEIGLPESVRDVIGRRLRRLSESCTKVLAVAAVLGREFALDALERVAGLERERLFEVLDEAVQAKVVEDAPQRLGRYRFSHALVRESLYEELGTLERFRNHLRVAEVLEALHSQDPGPHLAELAHHFRQALPGGDVDKAVDYATRAGDYASAQLAYEEAAMHYGRALEALDVSAQSNEGVRCDLLLKHGEACWGAGFDTTKSLKQAADLAERLGDSEILARAALGCAGNQTGLYVMVAEPLQLSLLARALAALEDRDSALRARVMSRLCTVRVFLDIGAVGGALEHLPDNLSLARRAIEMARRVGDKGALAYVLATGMWAFGPDDLDEMHAQLDEVVRLAEEAGDERLIAEAHLWKARHYLEVGDRAAADREAEIQDRYATTSRQAYHLWQAALGRAGRLLTEGRFDEAEVALRTLSEKGSMRHALVGAVSGCFNFLHEQQGRASEDLPRILEIAAQNPRIMLWRASAAMRYATSGRTEDARREFESIAEKDFSDIPRDMMWLFIMSRLCDLAIHLADVRRAAILYDLLLPYEDRYVVTGGLAASRGAVARSLGGLATLLSRYDDAERHFERSLELNARMRHRIFVAHTQHDYARMLARRDAPGDREKAVALAADALATAREVGMKPLESKLVELRAKAGFPEEDVGPGETQPTPGAPASFRRDGDFWSIAYEGKRVRLKDAKGLQYIAHLLRHADRDFHAADLTSGSDVVITIGREGGVEIARGLGDAGEVLDAQARSEYRERLEDLKTEHEEATRWGDTGRAASLNEEIEFLTEELSAAYGAGGRVRKAGDVANRARKAVTSRIRDTIARIAKEHPALGRHLENAIRTGVFCSYRPDRSPEWKV
jgi:eukaryotic-like serine/threonine-protein kinase